MPYTHFYKKLFSQLLCMGFVLSIAACQPIQPDPTAPLSPLSPLTTPESVAVPEQGTVEQDEAATETDADTSEVQAKPAAIAEETTTISEQDENALLTEGPSRRPRLLNIPAIALRTIIKPMGWTIAEVRGERATKWVIPATGVGWHINSATVGDPGNMIVSGHQSVGDAILAPIALGDAAVGQEILITDGEGQVFAYKIVEVSDPVPIIGASDEEKALALSYMDQPEDEEESLLTIMTGWPDFTTTHRIFVVAEFVGTVDN